LASDQKELEKEQNYKQLVKAQEEHDRQRRERIEKVKSDA
jgi:hypothetical protein